MQYFSRQDQRTGTAFNPAPENAINSHRFLQQFAGQLPASVKKPPPDKQPVPGPRITPARA